MVRTTVVQGWGEIIGGEVQIFQRDGGSRDTEGGGGVVDDGVIVRSVNQSVRHQVSTRSQTTARLQGQKFLADPGEARGSSTKTPSLID